MNKLLDENLMARQMQAWLAALALLALAPLKPEWLARPAAATHDRQWLAAV